VTEVLPIGDLIDTLIDYRGKTPPKTPSGVPLITAKVIKGGRIIGGSQEYIAEETYDSWMRRGLPRSGDILVTTEAPLGEVARVGPDSRIALAQRVILLRPDPSKVEPGFLFHYLRSPEAQHRLRRRASGTTVAGIRQPELRSVEVTLLSRPAQRSVALVLDALDDLIANNRRRIELLEQMAEAIYREWFVRFRYPGPEGTAFVESSLGSIPGGWDVQPLGRVAALDRTGIQPSRYPSEVFDHYSIPAFDSGQLPVPDLGDTIRSGKFQVLKPAVLVSKLNPRIERTWLVLGSTGRRRVASTEFLVLRPTDGLPLEYLYLAVRSAGFQERLIELSGGTSTSHQRTKPNDFLAIEVVVPDIALAGAFSLLVRPQLASAGVLRAEMRALSAIRDLLLPRLVTGRIDVSALDLNALVESVA
jgi:type I restriction enzyme S subunit